MTPRPRSEAVKLGLVLEAKDAWRERERKRFIRETAVQLYACKLNKPNAWTFRMCVDEAAELWDKQMPEEYKP